jgi:hypothetical protein
MTDADWITSRFHKNSEGGFTISRTQDVEHILDRNKELQNTPQKSDWGRHIASIPLVFIEKWANEEGANLLTMGKDEAAKFIRRKLKDPDWRWLKTTDKPI